MMKMMKQSCGTLLMCLMALGLFANIASAASYVVSNTTSSGAGSLSAAITSANSDNVDSEITFDPTVFATFKGVVLSGTQLILANNGKLSITGPAARFQIDGNSASRVFSVASGADVTLTRLRIVRGRSATGAGIINGGTLTMNNCSVDLNASTDFGGGIYNIGTLTMNNSTLSGNSAVSNGGAIHNPTATLILTNCL